MGRKRIILALVMLMAFGASTISGLATAQPKKGDGSLSPSGSWASRPSVECSGLLFSTPPTSNVHCLSEASADEASRGLGVTTSASTAADLDPTGLTQLGQGFAFAIGSLSYEGRLKGTASTVTVTVEATIDNAGASANSPLVSGQVQLYVRAWPHMAFSQGVQEFVTLADSYPSTEAPSSVENGTHTFTLVLNAERMRGHINLRVGLFGYSSVGFITCEDNDQDGFCDEGTLEAHDGSGIATASGSVVINSVKMEVTR